MAIAFQSAQSATGTTSLVITKPTSTAVGDLLIANIVTQSSTVDTAPSGWTLLTTQTFTGGGIKVYYIIATATEVAATNFTWTASTNAMGGGIARITGDFHSTPLAVLAKNTAASTTSPSYDITVTPLTVNSYLLYFVGAGSSGAGTTSASAYAITTSNPSWGEAFDVAYDTGGSGNIQSSLAYASRPEVTATGNATLTFSGARTSGAVMLVVRPKITTTISETLALVESTKKSVSKTQSDSTSLTDTYTDSKGRTWTRTSKPSTTWTRVNK